MKKVMKFYLKILNSKILKRVFVVGVGVQIVFIALVLFSGNFRIALSNLSKSNTVMSAVVYLVFFGLRTLDIMMFIIAPFFSFFFLLSKNKNSNKKS